jgi:hypothetical protein
MSFLICCGIPVINIVINVYVVLKSAAAVKT